MNAYEVLYGLGVGLVCNKAFPMIIGRLPTSDEVDKVMNRIDEGAYFDDSDKFEDYLDSICQEVAEEAVDF